MERGPLRDHANRDQWEEEWTEFVAAGEDMRVQEIIDGMKLIHLQPFIRGENIRCSLEVGCGTGNLSSRLSALGYRTTCLDFSGTAIRLAQKRYFRDGLKGAFIQGDAFQLPFRSESFDLVLSTGLLEHFADPQLVVNEMVRILRTGGAFYSDIWPKKFSLFRAFDVLRRIKNRLRGRREMFERRFDERTIQGMLEVAGLSGIQVFPAGVFPPILPVVFRVRGVLELYSVLLGKLARFSMSLDGSGMAKVLGCYYFVAGFKK